MHVSSSQFTYDKLNKKFTTEISDLGPSFRFVQIYPDAADLGFTMISAKTGKEVRFFVDQIGENRDGDITHWVCKPDMYAVRKNPSLNGVTVTIFND